MKNIIKISSECVTSDNNIENVKKVLQYCNTLESNIHDKNKKVALNMLYESLYCINSLYKCIGLAKLIGTPNISTIENLVEEHKNSFYKNANIMKIFVFFDKNKDNTDHTIEKILKNFKQYDSNGTNYKQKIRELENHIRKKIEIVYPLESQKIKKYVKYPNSTHNINVNRQTYYYLQRKIPDANLRCEIEKIFFQKSSNVLDLFADLVSQRAAYANAMGFNTYFEMIRKQMHANSEDIKSLINDLVLKIDSRSRKEMERIHRELKKDGYDKKIDAYDIMYYHEKMKTKILFSIDTVLKIIFNILKKYFEIKVEMVKESKLWDNSVVTYKFEISEKKLGVIHFDLIKRTGKKIIAPVAVHLCHNYTDMTSETHQTRIALVAGYDNMNKKCITYSDVIYIFREIGYCVQLMFQTTENGLTFGYDEFDTLLPQIFEYIAWEKETLSGICETSDDTVVEHILFTRFIDFAHSIKIRCVNVLFDHVIHNSDDLIKMIENNQNSKGNIIKTVYKKIYGEIMSSQNDIINLNINGINPLSIYQEINGSEGTLYGSLLTEMLSFSVFSLIKNGNGKNFLLNVINSEYGKMKKNVYKFISALGEDGYYIYLQKLIGYNEIDTEINMNNMNNMNNIKTKCTSNSDNNYYAEETNVSSDDDFEEIIHMN